MVNPKVHVHNKKPYAIANLMRYAKSFSVLLEFPKFSEFIPQKNFGTQPIVRRAEAMMRSCREDRPRRFAVRLLDFLDEKLSKNSVTASAVSDVDSFTFESGETLNATATWSIFCEFTKY